MAEVTFLTGASSGLGRDLAPLLAADGDALALVARRAEPLEELAHALRGAGHHAVALPCDVTDREAVFAAVARCKSELGEVTRLISNAGILIANRGTEFRAEVVEQTFRTNLFAAAYAIEAVLPDMIAARRGHLVGISSLAARGGLPTTAAYGASKAALCVLLESLRIELRRRDIDVTTIMPGYITTELTEENRGPMPFLIDAPSAARKIHRAIKRRKRVYALPRSMAAVTFWSQFVPRGLYDRAARNLVTRHVS